MQQLNGKQKTAIKNSKPLKNIKNVSKKTLGFSKQEKHILALPGNYYTLQLLSMHNEDQVKNFIKKHNLQNKANYYKSHFKGKDWYVVVYGSFANKTDAQLALAKLPADIKKLQPWPREFANIHYSLNTRGKND